MIGESMHGFAHELWGLNRSLTGDGLRETLERIRHHLPTLATKSIPSGTPVFDWIVPKEWKVRNAWLIDPAGRKRCDFSSNNLHLLGYSTPFSGSVSLDELQGHLHSLPEQPDAIPYVTSYYRERWGFCLSQHERDALPEGDYRVLIDSELFDGELNYGELIIPGRSEQEVFLSTYVCHPSMANNELSGPVVTTFLARWLLDQDELRHTYRIVFIPETIGSISYLSANLDAMKRNVVAGFNVSCVGDDRAYSYLPSRQGHTISDRVARHVLHWTDPDYARYRWTDRGSDERQYCAPGVDLPIASMMRTKYGMYPEYHTSLDNLTDVVTPAGLEGGYQALRRALQLLERNGTYRVNVLCEPQMGARGLYPTLSTKRSGGDVRTMMNLISYCDGEHDLLDIARLIEMPAWDLYDIVDTLEAAGLISAC